MYLIPRNVVTRFEFFPGFGWFELISTGIAFLIGLGLFVLLGIFTASPLRFVLLILFPAAVFFVTRKDYTNQSLLDLIIRFRHWQKNQKQYLYKRMCH